MNKPNTIEKMHQIAKRRGGKCLSEIYINNKQNLFWECKNGHTWHAAAMNVINNGTWCSVCSGRNVLTIEKMHEVANAKNGKCLSNKYVNSDTKLLWECKVGHRWEASANSIIHGDHWCPECAGTKKRTIDEMKLFALSKGGICLSEKYINRKTKLLWECSHGHQWRVLHGYLMRSNAWCPKCSKKAKPTIEELKILAKENGGRCLSEKYLSNKTKMRWQCADGHIFEMQQANVKSGQWCPECSNPYKTEGKCRYIMEFLLETEFAKTRQILGNGLELDGYSKKI